MVCNPAGPNWEWLMKWLQEKPGDVTTEVAEGWGVPCSCGLPCYSRSSIAEVTHTLSVQQQQKGFWGQEGDWATLYTGTAGHPKLIFCCSSKYEGVRKSLTTCCGMGVSISYMTLWLVLVKFILSGRLLSKEIYNSLLFLLLFPRKDVLGPLTNLIM